MGITEFKIQMKNEINNTSLEPVRCRTFLGALIYLFKFYYKSKKEGTNSMTYYTIEKIRLG